MNLTGIILDNGYRVLDLIAEGGTSFVFISSYNVDMAYAKPFRVYTYFLFVFLNKKL